MKTAMLDMPVAKALEELARWRPGRTKEDILIAKAFRAIAKRQKVIDLHESMRLAGVDAEGRPMLAITRADSSRCQGFVNKHQPYVTFRSNAGRYWLNEIHVPNSFFGGELKEFDARAITPIIPPIYRPAQASLRNYWILFEASWMNVTKDPMLLQHLGGALYRVVAQWDLTPIERAVLKGRR